MKQLQTVKLGIGLRSWYVVTSARYNRGLGYMNIIKQPMIALAALKIFNVPLWALIALVPCWFVGWYAVGWADQLKAKVWQEEAKWGAYNVAPWNKDLMKRIKNIEKRLTDEHKR